MALSNRAADMVSEKVSIIMPSYNVSRVISESIESGMAQTHDNWELIICDDGSTDDSATIAHDYATRDSRILVVNNKYKKGAPGARNSCLDVAEGRYIAFLDSDDLWLPSKLELQIDFMISNRYAFVYSYHQTMSEYGDFVSECMAPGSVSAKLMRVSNFIPCLTALYDCKIIGKVYQPDIKKRNDFALFLTILNGGKVTHGYCLPVVTAAYRVNSYGLSSNKMDAVKYFNRCLREFGGCNAVSGFLYTLAYVFVTLIKKKCVRFYNWLVVAL